MPAVGTSVARKDGIGKATGATKYADDLHFPGMLHGRTVRASIARGRVTGIRYDFDTTGFTIVDWRDIPAAGRNIVALVEYDQPFLVEREVRHLAEPIVLLAHENREVLLAATVVIDYEEEEPEFDPELSDVIFKSLAIDKGNVEAALRCTAPSSAPFTSIRPSRACSARTRTFASCRRRRAADSAARRNIRR